MASCPSSWRHSGITDTFLKAWNERFWSMKNLSVKGAISRHNWNTVYRRGGGGLFSGNCAPCDEGAMGKNRKGKAKIGSVILSCICAITAKRKMAQRRCASNLLLFRRWVYFGTDVTWWWGCIGICITHGPIPPDSSGPNQLGWDNKSSEGIPTQEGFEKWRQSLKYAVFLLKFVMSFRKGFREPRSVFQGLPSTRFLRSSQRVSGWWPLELNYVSGESHTSFKVGLWPVFRSA